MMVRNILTAIAGYIAMAAVLFVLFSLLWVTLGPSRAFQPGSWEVPVGWALGSLVLGFVAACAGGKVCARVAHDARAAKILIGLVIVFGVVRALMPVEMAAGPRPDDLSLMEATAGALHPAWFNWLNPLIGAAGVWFGSRKSRAYQSSGKPAVHRPYPGSLERHVL